jgi:hypothetical protein
MMVGVKRKQEQVDRMPHGRSSPRVRRSFKNFLVGFAGYWSSENASLGLLMKPRGKNQRRIKNPSPRMLE